MFGIPIRLPFVIIILLATCWVFALIYWKPEWVKKTRLTHLYLSILEGLVCGLIWGTILHFTLSDPLEGIVLSATCTGAIWIGCTYYGRLRYIQMISRTPRTFNEEF